MAEPHRRFTGGRLVIATHNKGKVAEIAALLAAFPVEAVAAGALGLPEPDETETTFIGNATLKARAAALATGSPALADDSGIEVAALNGAPGVYTADWAGVPRDFMVAMRRVEDAMAESGNPDRSARFVCALSLVWPDGHVEAFQGKVDGHLVWPPRGDRGFGFDPVFVPHGHDITFAEMDPAAKHAMSHRADAFAQLVAACFTAPETATP